MLLLFFFFNDTATTEIYTLSLHDALPIWALAQGGERLRPDASPHRLRGHARDHHEDTRSEEHTSELQSRQYLVCRLLLEKKKNNPRLETIHYRILIVLPLSARTLERVLRR